ncbi:hypothetical protein N7931_12425 [Catenovulum sp. 2E275]|uniref:flagellar hook assembly protein FlgD n=1 Tax=Catenovulum sp. 2E275 TaxID=2980497 RepID=UPI0021CF9A9D|nr:flagellar hook capping FlgD N-terminal domain-containing protein [Catenovulum sp. 2E275]MCU4676435.1 hypothetical protein [Catenovulum sp. 2E275]
MSTVDTSYVDSLKWNNKTTTTSTTETSSDKALGQEDFFALLTTQLAAQDPTNPTSNDEMISQMTNFTMAEGITELGTKFDSFTSQFAEFLENTQASQTSNKALQASSMVGQTVLVESNEVPLFQFDEESYGMSGQLMMENGMNDIRIEVKDSSGKVVNTIEVGAVSEGPAGFYWDGMDKDGNQMSAGVYTLNATGIDATTGKRADISVGAYTSVNSVSFGSGNSLSLNLAGLGSVTMDDILEVAS